MPLIKVLKALKVLVRATCLGSLLWLLVTPIGAIGAVKPAAGGDIYLYISPTTDKYFASQKQSYLGIIRRWGPYMQKFGQHGHTTDRAQLLKGLPGGVLILPTSVALDDEERAAIGRFAAAGGSILGSGLVGTRNAQGEYVGLDFLHNTFHVKSHGFFPETDDTFFMPYGDGPVTWTIPAARRMPVAGLKDSSLRLSAKNESAVIMDWSRTGQTEPHAAMAFEEVGLSRVAYFSPNDGAWPARSKDNPLLLDSVVSWLRREPQAFKAAWPHGHVACHLMEMDTEDKYFSAPNFAKDLEAHGYKGTFYSLTSEASRVPDVVKDLMKRGHEIAYHADVHFGFKDDPVEEQELRIKFMIQQMQGILGPRTNEATGFRAPTESYDKNTEILLRKHGMLHHAADMSSHDDKLPFFSISESNVPIDKALVVLPRAQWDDINFTRMRLNREQSLSIMKYDLDLTVKSGAFGLLSVHSQTYIPGGLMFRAMPEYVKYVAGFGDQIWITRGDAIALWWRQREAVTVNQQWKDGGLLVDVSNRNTQALAGLSVFVTLPERNASLTVSANPKTSTVRVKPVDAFRAAVVFDNLPVGNTQLRISFP